MLLYSNYVRVVTTNNAPHIQLFNEQGNSQRVLGRFYIIAVLCNNQIS